MKKKLLLLALITITFMTTGCSKEEKTTCTKVEETATDTTVFVTKKDKVKKIERMYTYESSAYNIESFDSLTDSQKEQIKSSVLASYALEKDEYRGFSIDVTFTDKMEVKMIIDLRKVSQETLHNIDSNIRNTNVDISNVVYSYEAAGYTCK